MDLSGDFLMYSFRLALISYVFIITIGSSSLELFMIYFEFELVSGLTTKLRLEITLPKYFNRADTA